jgi:hypothetical protein
VIKVIECGRANVYVEQLYMFALTISLVEEFARAVAKLTVYDGKVAV